MSETVSVETGFWDGANIFLLIEVLLFPNRQISTYHNRDYRMARKVQYDQEKH